MNGFESQQQTCVPPPLKEGRLGYQQQQICMLAIHSWLWYEFNNGKVAFPIDFLGSQMDSWVLCTVVNVWSGHK